MNEYDSLAEKKIDSKDIFEGNVLHVKFDRVSLPDGNEATREIIRHVGAVCIVPVTDDGKVDLNYFQILV